MSMEQLTLSQVRELAQKTDALTFDVFDTLIMRDILHPTDLFALVEARVKNELSIDLPFHSLRTQAEEEAYQKLGPGLAGLDDIYDCLAEKTGLPGTQIQRIKQIELDEEARHACPRQDMLSFFQEQRALNKPITLISDMYLPSAEIRTLLLRCGYPADVEIWVSCEKKATKASGKLWQVYFESHIGLQTLHIGDNAHSDYRMVRRFGHAAALIPNPLEAFEASPLYPSLRRFDDGTPANSLFLGTLVNLVFLNSAFGSAPSLQDAAGIWLGPALGCFFHWLVDRADDSLLLFVTREGYLFLPIYRRYCQARGVAPQPGVLYYASRQALASASFQTDEDLEAVVQQPFTGTFSGFLHSRLNFHAPSDASDDWMIELPKMKRKVLDALAPYREDIIARSRDAAQTYREYTTQARANAPDRPLTIVDIGYQGTAQFYLSRILNEKVGGRYIFLSEQVLPRQLDCPCESLAVTTDGMHPVYENLLFLEAAIQVPYGQLLYLERDGKGNFSPVCNQAAQTAPQVEEAQAGMADFIERMGAWAALYGNAFAPSLELAEELYVHLLHFDRLPGDLLSVFRIDDAYSGHSLWEYDSETRRWCSNNTSVPLVYVDSSSLGPFKLRTKNWVKRHSPAFLYEPLRVFWVKHIK